MSSFPPIQWQVRYLQDMDTMVGTPLEDHPISMAALMAVKPAGGDEGSFRFTLAGPEHVKLQIHVYDILKHDPFKDVYLELQLELGTQVTITLYSNISCTVNNNGMWKEKYEIYITKNIYPSR